MMTPFTLAARLDDARALLRLMVPAVDDAIARKCGHDLHRAIAATLRLLDAAEADETDTQN